ncbi:MAG: 16S rRNA (cytosine(967)-C(5))-methyltransferase RsmB [Verrucomicrobia bacterium]|nr:16S rRNA (cytosine(967)-C(5))-methyltransferase RsmB [Verrucomicrobiota bacterium]
MNGQKPREIAAQILQRRRGGDEFIESLLERALAGAKFSAADRGLCQELVYGVVRWQATLDWLIARKTAGRTQKPALQDLLRLGLYQIFWLDRIPDHAAVNETVEMAKLLGFGPQAGFINAVLRGYLREHDETRKLLADLKVSQPALGWSHPEWLVERWRKRWGDEHTRQLLEWNNTPPKTFARVNMLKFGSGRARHSVRAEVALNQSGAHGVSRPTMENAGDLLTQWRDEDVEYDFVRHDWIEENLVFELKSHPPLATLPSFTQGLFYVQDPGTLLAVRELDPHPGDTILDFCAAPGGKTTFIAQLMNNQGRIVAQDVSEERLKLVRENCARLGVTCVQIVSASAFSLQPSAFDKVLLDAPCSNTGVMRRRVDLRWRIQPEEIQRLRTMQLDLLRQAAIAVKPGGVLVYSTCSLEPEENSEVVKEFLAARRAFTLERERELRPFADGVDGAFVAAFVRARL